ncbi:uncharacterized protein LOC126674562 [Mercurialis annua]|uniref:uncharacterized protein LOC126674562 n=1 Tax=Mercurialis annua TaxID=3986 RepID=UPI0024AE654A|nr:uncharacterized protein LOC126674562 [Mercurialis annua]
MNLHCEKLKAMYTLPMRQIKLNIVETAPEFVFFYNLNSARSPYIHRTEPTANRIQSPPSSSKIKTMETPTEIPSLPSVIIMEILTRLEAKHVIKCKIICKQWNSLIQEQYFTNKHVHQWRTTLISSSITWRVHADNNNDGDTNQNNFELIAQSYGVTVERSSNKNDAVRPGGCEILTLGGGGDLSWRIIQIPSLHDLNRSRERTRFNMQFPDKYTFYFMRIGLNLAQIISISLNDESVATDTLPENTFENPAGVSFFYFSALEKDSGSDEGYITYPGFAEIVKNKKELHIVYLVGNRNNRWSKKREVPLIFVGEDEMTTEIEPLFCIKPLVYFRNGKQWLVYDIKSCNRDFVAEKLMVNKSQLTRESCNSCSLLTFKGMQPERKNLEFTCPFKR